jgi:hypothetical protein
MPKLTVDLIAHELTKRALLVLDQVLVAEKKPGWPMILTDQESGTFHLHLEVLPNGHGKVDLYLHDRTDFPLPNDLQIGFILYPHNLVQGCDMIMHSMMSEPA